MNMKKICSLAVAAALFGIAQASAATFPVVFNGTDNAGWAAGDNAKIENGHLAVTMTENNGKWRQDLGFAAADATADYTVNAGTMKLLAVKFIGARPQGNMTLEIQYRTNDNQQAWMNTKWKNSPDGTVMTTGGNSIYYYNLTKDELWTGEISICKINFKIADNTQDPHSYTLDWINVFASKEAIEADWKDDGDSDADEATAVEQPVMIGAKGYATLKDAIDEAVDDDVILVNENQNLPSARVTINKALTIKGNKDGIVVKNGFNNQAYIITGKAVTMENLTLDGDNKAAINYISVEGNGKLTLNNIKIQNYTFNNSNSNKLIHVKGGSLINLNGVKVENVNGPEGVGMVNINNEGCTINGDNNISIHLNGSYTLTVPDGGALTGGPVNVYVTDHAIDAPVIKGCTDPNAFNLMKTGNKLVAKDGNLILAASENSAVNEIEGVDENAPVEYYNLQGMKVNGELTPGIYVRRQGGKTVKVLVK